MPRLESTLRAAVAALALVVPLFASGCAAVLVGAAVGGGGYEAVQAKEMDKLEEDYKAGRISKQEYEARRDQIDKSSAFQ